MNWKRLGRRLSHKMHSHSSEIFAAMALFGLGASMFLVNEASPEAHEIIKVTKDELEETDDETERQIIQKETIKEIAKLYLPAVVSGIITAGCIVASNKISHRRRMALASLYSASQGALIEYREKVKNHVGEQKAQKIDEDIAQDHFNKVDMDTAIHTGWGDDRIMESITGQPLYSDIEHIIDLWHDTEDRIRAGDDVLASEWFCDIGLNDTKIGDHLIWRYDPTRGIEAPRLIKRCVMVNGKPGYYLDYSTPPQLCA